MLYIPLAALHHGAAHAGIPAPAVGHGIRFWKMQIGIGHNQLLLDAIEAKLAIGPLKGQWMRQRSCVFANKPLIHAPEMRRTNVYPEVVYNARDQRELLGRSDRPTNAHWIIFGGLAPGIDIFQRFGQVKILERLVKNNVEPGTGQLEHRFRGQRRGRSENLLIESCVIPPIWSDGTASSRHGV